jgi:hypothetical protein
LVIDDDTTASILFNTSRLKVETIGVRATTNGDKNNIGFKLQFAGLVPRNKFSGKMTYRLLFAILGGFSNQVYLAVFLVGR